MYPDNLAIRFFDESPKKLFLPKKINYRLWIRRFVYYFEPNRQGGFNYIFCDDNTLLELNKKYLGKNNLTDVIAFPNENEKGKPEADIYISIDRVKENAKKFNVPFTEELKRVIAHGTLHFLGFNDKDKTQAEQMKNAEDFCLNAWGEVFI